MDEQAIAAPNLVTKLANRLQKWQALNVTDRAANFTNDKVFFVQVGADKVFYFIGNMRNDLHSRAQIVPATFTGQNIAIDSTGCHVVRFACRNTCEALIVPQVQIRLGTVISDIDFAMLIRTHGPRINIQIGIKFS